MSIDGLDADLLELVHDEPRVGVLEASRRLGVARGTVQARLDRLVHDGVLDMAPSVDPAALGYPVSAFVSVEIVQGQGHATVAGHLGDIAQVVEAHTTTGAGDVLIRVVARDHADLQRVINTIVDGTNVLRASTVIVLETPVRARTMPLVRAAVP